MEQRERKSYAEMMQNQKVCGGSWVDGSYFELDMTVEEFEREFGHLRRVNLSNVKDVEIDLRKEYPYYTDGCGPIKLVKKKKM